MQVFEGATDMLIAAFIAAFAYMDMGSHRVNR